MEIEFMKKIMIPDANGDLGTYAKRKNLKYLVLYIAYILFFSAAFLFFVFNRHEDATPLRIWVYPVYFAAVLLSGWFVCCMHRFAWDRSFRGTVKDTGFTRSFDRGLTRKAGFAIDDHTYVKITAIDENGKKRSVRVQLFDDGYDGYYREGGTIVKYRGLNYPICPESEREGAHLCAVCGVRTYYLEGRQVYGESVPEIRNGVLICRLCGHTMIGDPEEKGLQI